jgi:uncharacterized protein YceK
MRGWPAVACLVLPLLLSGCGTVLNFTGGKPVPYGGVAKDVAFAWTPAEGRNGGGGGQGLLFLWLADFGLSAVADTLTFPAVLYLVAIKGKSGPDTPAPPNSPAQYSVGAVAVPAAP